MKRHSKTPIASISCLERLGASLHGDIPDFKKLTINEKQQFIRQHEPLIRLFAETFGDPATMRLFSLPERTLWAIKDRANRYRKSMTKGEEQRLRETMILEAIKGLTKRLDYMEVRFESVPEIRREIRETREEFEKFTEISANRVAKMLIEPMLKSMLKSYGGKLPELV